MFLLTLGCQEERATGPELPFPMPIDAGAVFDAASGDSGAVDAAADATLEPDFSMVQTPDRVRVATYNLQNLYDLVDDPTKDEGEFTPSPGRWDAARLRTRLDRFARALVALNADIVAVVEIENELVLGQLAEATRAVGGPDYAYQVVSTARNSRNMNVGVLSRYPIRFSRVRRITFPYECTDRDSGELITLGTTETEPRPILQAEIDLGGESTAADLVLLVNHWKAKTGTSYPCVDEAHRVRSGLALRALHNNLVQVLPNRPVVMLGDFNAYEFEEPLAQALAGRLDEGEVEVEGIFNTWGQVLDPDIQGNSNQWNNAANSSYNFRGSWGRLDHILVSANMLDAGSAEWRLLGDSVGSLTAAFLLDRGTPNGWSVEHPNGTSDHLPVFVELSPRP